MWRTALLVALLPFASRGQAGDAFDTLDDVENGLQRDIDEVDQDDREKHRQAHFLGLVNRGVEETQPHGEMQLLPGRHPEVAHKLHSMHEQLRDLEDRKTIASHARSNLEGNVNQALQHLDSVVTIKNQLAKTEVQIRSEERKLKKLEEQRKHLDVTHQSLSASLHRVMDPKIDLAFERLGSKKRQLVKLQDRQAEWRTKEDEYHASSLAMLAERRKDAAGLEAALATEQQAHQARQVAEKKLVKAKQDTRFDIEAYRYSNAKERAATSREERGEAETERAKVSVKRLEHILQMEQRRVDESMAIGMDGLSGKIQRLQSAKGVSTEKLGNLKQEFATWRAEQESWASQVAAKQGSTSAAAKDFADMQDRLTRSAQDQVVSDAEGSSDWTGWDEWPGRAGNDGIA